MPASPSLNSGFTVNVKWDIDENYDSHDLGKYTNSPRYSGIVYDRKLGRLEIYGTFAGVGERNFERNEYRYIQLPDCGKWRGCAKVYLADVDQLERLNSDRLTPMVVSCVICLNGVTVGQCYLDGYFDDMSQEYRLAGEVGALVEAKADAVNWLTEIVPDSALAGLLESLDTAIESREIAD